MQQIINVVVGTLIYLSQGIPALVVCGLAVILMLLALIRKDPSLMLTAALCILPVAYAFGAWAGILLVVRLLPLFVLLSAFAISREEPVFAWILPLPPFGYLLYFIFRLVSENFSGV